jgi:hypothetical protein
LVKIAQTDMQIAENRRRYEELRAAGQELTPKTREAFAGYLQAWAKTEFHTEIEGKTLPVKVIVGANDGALTADVMKVAVSPGIRTRVLR